MNIGQGRICKKSLNRSNKNKLLLLFFSIFCFLNFTEVFATTLRINPTKIRLVVPPGESKSGSIEVENTGEGSIVVKAYFQDWAYNPLQNGSKDFFPASSTPLSCADWIDTSFSDFVIPSFGRQILNYTVKVPEKAEGGHYAVLFFESMLARPELKDSAQLGVVVRIGVLFYIEPAGTIKRTVEITNPVLEKGSNGESLIINLDLKNTGNTDITASGIYHIMDRTGMVLARGEFGDVFTFPQDKSKLSSIWSKALPKGKYDLIFTINTGKALEELGLGRVPAITKEAELEVGSGGNILNVGELK